MLAHLKIRTEKYGANGVSTSRGASQVLEWLECRGQCNCCSEIIAASCPVLSCPHECSLNFKFHDSFLGGFSISATKVLHFTETTLPPSSSS